MQSIFQNQPPSHWNVVHQTDTLRRATVNTEYGPPMCAIYQPCGGVSDHAHDTNWYTVIKWFPVRPSCRIVLASLSTPLFDSVPKVFRTCSVKDWRCDVDAKSTSAIPRWSSITWPIFIRDGTPKWVQHDIDWSSIWKVRARLLLGTWYWETTLVSYPVTSYLRPWIYKHFWSDVDVN